MCPAVINASMIPSFLADDGARIQELAGLSTGLTGHSLAHIIHPPSSATRPHHHPIADEVYYVLSGRGLIRLGDETSDIGPGDVVRILPGKLHQVWNAGEEDLVLLVTCSPAYDASEVVWDN